MNDVINFINQDILYKNALAYFDGRDNIPELLMRAGMIKEPRTKEDTDFLNDYSILSMPILNNIGNDNAIIVSTGSFSPMHEGHVQAMMIAKEYVEKLGYNVIQGVLSLSHDNYVSFKNNGVAKNHITKRTMLAYEKIDSMGQQNWLKVDRMEGEMVSCAINFSTVLKRIYDYVKYHLKIEKLKVFYVFGSDNADFSYAFVNNDIYHSLCIERGGYGYAEHKEALKAFKNIHFLENNSLYKTFSSTEVRKKKISEPMTHVFSKKPIYLIRKNGASDDFCIGLKNIFENYIDSKIEVRLFETTENHREKTISLDKFVSGDYNIDTSRLFEISSYQNKANGMTSLSGDLLGQIESIPPGEYTLLDDDSVSGYTIEKIKACLKEKGIYIKDVQMLIDDFLSQDEILYDVVDARDFLVEKTKYGLVVFKEGEICRTPYLFPEVNLTTRASIIPEFQIPLSKDICLLNKRLNKDLDTERTDFLLKLYNNFLNGSVYES